MMKNSMSFFARCRYVATMLAICVCMCVCSLSGCSKGGDDPIENPNQPEKPTEVTLSLSTEELVFEAKGGLLEFTINSSVAWTITGGNAWCQPGATSGTGNTQVKIIAEAYTGTTDRNVVLTVKAGNLTKTLTVTQKAVQALTLTKDKFDVPQEGGDITVEVKSNIDYTVSIPETYKEWITEAPQSKAMVTKSFRFSIAANEETEKREGHIVINGNDLKDTVYVYQAEGRCLILDKDSCTLSAQEQELTVELRTNVDYEIVIPDTVSDWVNRQPESRALRTDKLQLLIGENEQPEERQAVVIVKDKNSELADTLHIRQQVKEEEAEEPEKGFSVTSYTLEYQANSTNTIWFTVSVSWKATISYEGEESGWLSLSATSGAKGNPYITISSTSKNEAITPRKAYIDITYGSKTQRLTVTQLANEEIDITDKFDPEFARVLQEKKYIQDATHITVGEVDKITYLDLTNSQLTSLQGIEYFTALMTLFCESNQLTTLDISKNTALTLLNCNLNQLTTLDVSRCITLRDLECYKNQLTTLDVSQNTALTHLYCGFNQLTTLDVSKNTALTHLSCNLNQLTTLDISKNTELTDLDCGNNQLTTLDISKNTELTDLDCGNNQLTILDVSKNTALTILYCYPNQLTTLDVSKNTELTHLHCGYNQLTTLDISKNTELTDLDCGNNQLTILDVSKNTKLTSLACSNNQLSTLDISKNTELTSLNCNSNQLTTLDVSQNTELTYLWCDNNPGNGTVFLLIAWFDADNIPSNIENLTTSWRSDELQKNITLQIIKAGSGEFPYLNLGKKELAMSADGGETTIPVSTNVEYDVVIPNEAKGWVVCINAGSEEMKLFVAANSTTDAREAKIALKARGKELSDTLLIRQAAKGQASEYLSLGKRELAMSADGGETTIPVSTNVEYDVVIPNEAKGWVVCINAGSEEMKLYVAANSTSETREAKIALKARGKELSDTLLIRQAAKGQIEPDPGEYTEDFPKTDYTLAYQTELLTIEFSVPSEWSGYVTYDYYSITGIEDPTVWQWLSPSRISGKAGKNTVTFKVKKNVRHITQKAYISITHWFDGTYKTQQITVNQLPTEDENIAYKFDPDFALYLKENRYIQDASYFTQEEINQITTLSTGYLSEITSLRGLEYFKSLTDLSIYGVRFNSLDAGNHPALKKLSCNYCNLQILDVSNNTELTDLDCSNNLLTTLDVSNCTNLNKLSCSQNRLNTLDVSRNIQLTYLHCTNNTFSTLDISNCAELAELYCNDNQIDILNANNCTKLQTLICSNNHISNIDVNNCSELKTLQCATNHLTALDVSNCTKLNRLDCQTNRLTTLNLKNCINLTSLNFSTNFITAIDLTDCTRLTSLSCSDNQITALKLNNCQNLTDVTCTNNQLTSLNLNYCTELSSLYCPGNLLTTLSIDNCKKLTTLYCNRNKLSTLSVSNNTSLTALDCNSNQLTNLDLSQNTKLTRLDCGNNELSILDISNNPHLTNLDCEYNKLQSLDISKILVRFSSIQYEYNPGTLVDNEWKFSLYLREDQKSNITLWSSWIFENKTIKLNVNTIE